MPVQIEVNGVNASILEIVPSTKCGLRAIVQLEKPIPDLEKVTTIGVPIPPQEFTTSAELVSIICRGVEERLETRLKEETKRKNLKKQKGRLNELAKKANALLV